MYQTLVDNVGLRRVFSPGTVTDAATYGQWINIQGYDEILFVPQIGSQDSNIVVTAYQNSEASSSGATVVKYDGTNNVTGTFTNGSHEDFVGGLTVRADDLDSGNTYVTIQVDAVGAGEDFSAVALLANRFANPVSNGSTDGVAFKVGQAN